MPDQSKDYTALQRPLEVFRATTRRLTIHPSEMTLLWVVGAHLVFLPWAIGGMRPWGQFISFGLALLSFGLALLPRNYTEEHTGSNRFRLIMWPKLVRFPIFWLGLALLGLVTTQALNPAWTYQTNGTGWWMMKIAYIEWLPTSVAVPFERWGPWRMLIIYSSAWMTVCAIWIGFTRRRTVQLFFLVLAINGLALAALGVTQQLLSNGKMFWFWESPSGAFFASFVYKNHAGAYLVLMLAITCGLAGWYYLRGLRRMEKSNPAGVLAFVTTCIAVSILTSYARGATLVMLVFLTISVVAFFLHQLLVPSENRKPVVGIILILLFGYFLKTGLEAVRSNIAWDRLKAGVMEKDASLESRRVATRAAIDMLEVNWVKGTGAGSFKFLFPTYQQRHPAIFSSDGRRMFWEHAHNDVVQTPVELGLAGMVIVVLSGGYWLVLLVRNFFWQNPLSAAVVLGLMLMMAYAWWDFPFQNPSILITWSALWCAVSLWTLFEESNTRA